ncbi:MULTISPECIES: DUF6175 family protein [unclassified Alistipes]|uniref:DUF6175 family protein n=1 Tax=unclassified Alistipes TaxID=2608932 RepID=UPI002588E252|nr:MULTISPECIES: DUF6175 family protein [unclassified Alistipes]HUN14475.1 DUF6175 family protein [Alistipes sp.]
MNKYLITIFYVLLFGSRSIAQTNTPAVTTVQPKIMVIPYTKEGEDIRTILEADVNKRIALTKIKEAFDSRGFTTVDFTAKLKAAGDNAIFTADNQTDLKSQIIQMSGADVYVEAETDVLLSSTGNSVKMLVTAYEISTGNSLANKVGESGKFYTDDISKLASKAIESCAEDFLNVMQNKFTDIVENGKSIIINFGFAEASVHTMSSEVGTQGLQLSDELELWMEEHAYKNNYHIQGTTDRLMIFDDVRIPLKDPVTGNNYNTNKFALEIFKFMRSLGLKIARDIKGNTIYITIQ